MKQSLKYHLPILNETINLSDFISKKHEENKFIAHCEEGVKKELRKKRLREKF